MKFVLKFSEGKTYKVTNSDGSIGKMINDSFHLVWLDNEGNKINDWHWSGRVYGERLQYVMTKKLQQLKSVLPDIILEHDIGENPLYKEVEICKMAKEVALEFQNDPLS